MSAIIGIDLGTTFSAAACIVDGTPQLIRASEGRIMPSVVGIAPDGKLLVGTPARNQHMLYPERTVRSIKRKMGQNTTVQLGERAYLPQEISALILRELKQRSEAVLGVPISQAVITVPAYFAESARQATYEAGELAGLQVMRIINEPTAAALAYGLNRSNERQLVAVYDLGGGTFDVSIIELDNGVVEVRASHGNTQLGGDDFDQRLLTYLAERMHTDQGVDPRIDPRAHARLLRAAEAAKITLSSEPFARVREEYLLSVEGNPLHMEVELARVEFEDQIVDLLEGTLVSFDAALEDAGVTADELDTVLLVGGSTRIPLVQRMLEEHTGIIPQVAINPDEAVALGAAVQAGIIAGEPLDAILVDVTPHSLGIEIAEWHYGELVPDRYSVIIQRNTTVPTSRSEVYSAVHPGQTTIAVRVYQGEDPVASNNILLGEFLFEDLRAEVAGQPPRVTVEFDFDINGILHISAVDRGSGRQASMSVQAARARLAPGDLRARRDELERLSAGAELVDADDLFDWDLSDNTLLPEDEPAAANEAAQTIGVESLLRRARRTLARVQGVQAAELQTALTALKDALQLGGQEAVEERAEALLDLLYELDDEDE